ncbi:hypothetical protein ACFQX7_40400 [Luedemannella flava]
MLTSAPAATLRATLDAGADPNCSDEYTEQTILEMIDQYDRDDLDFLVAAAKAAGVAEPEYADDDDD